MPQRDFFVSSSVQVSRKSKMRLVIVFCLLVSTCMAQQFCNDIFICLQSQCAIFPDWSKTYCKKTCGYCSGPQPPTQPPTQPPFPTQPPNPPPGQGQCGISSFQAGRVIGGMDARPGEWPWQVKIEYNDRFHCGGSLINENWLVTAAHCVDGTNKFGFSITLGDHNRMLSEQSEQSFTAAKVVSYPGYDRRRLQNDIALIKLSSPARLNKKVNKVCLPTSTDKPPVGSTCYITGWGKTSHPGSAATILQKAQLKIVHNNVCNQLNQAGTGNAITSSMICAGHGPSDRRGGCHGDSGGPLVCQNGNAWTLHGAVSWGSRECTTTKAYTVFARVTEFRRWIEKEIKK